MWNTWLKLAHRNGCGHRRVERACSRVISAVRRTNTNGARKISERAMATEWLATDVSKRRRRTCGGSDRIAAVLRAALGRMTVAVAIGAPPDSGPDGSRF